MSSPQDSPLVDAAAQLTSFRWAIERLVELRRLGEEASFRVTWAYRGSSCVYRLEVRRTNGFIERPVWPLPVGKNAVDESSPAEIEAEPQQSREELESLIEQLDEELCSLLHRGDEVGEHSPETHLALARARRGDGSEPSTETEAPPGSRPE